MKSCHRNAGNLGRDETSAAPLFKARVAPSAAAGFPLFPVAAYIKDCLYDS